jgi:hypothetical protein
MPPTAAELARAILRETSRCLDECLARIRHCLDQLSDEQVWWRPREEMNSIGNLVLHLTGNVRQWIVAGLGGAADVRARPREFSERGPIPKADLLRQLTDVVAEANDVLARLTAEQLLTERRIQGYDVTGVGAIFDSVPHFKGHTQEIISFTRLQRGNAYQFFWQPETPEQTADHSTPA